MRKLILIVSIFSVLSVDAQDSKKLYNTDFELGSGLNFSFNEGDYQFKLGGMIQPYVNFDMREDQDLEYLLTAKSARFIFEGKAVPEKVSFFIQAEFANSSPLFDAFITYHASPWLNIHVGQKMTPASNRELTIPIFRTQFTDRSLLSSTFGEVGREFGVYTDFKFSLGKMLVLPQLAITSGDGRNSFGSDSRDVDLGGFKWGARLDLYPFGEFADGNVMVADLIHESSPKLLIGAAANYNDGASDDKGAGHGNFFLYDANGGVQLPDYRQLFYDLIFKYKGFSLLGEYAIATATSLDGTQINEAGTVALVPEQISEYLSLGDALNVQAGYATKSGWAVDLGYSELTPEFADNSNSIVQSTKVQSIGLTKYLKHNNWKINVAYHLIENSDASKDGLAELMLQVVF